MGSEHWLVDRGDDNDATVEHATRQGMKVVIPPRMNRKVLYGYDVALYCHRNLVENASLQLKHWRGSPARYAKSAKSFLAAAQIRCVAIWAQLL